MISQLLSLLIHAVLIFGVFVIFKKPEFGIQVGEGGDPSKAAELSAQVEIEEEAAPEVIKVDEKVAEEKPLAEPDPEMPPAPGMEDVPDMAEVLEASTELAAPVAIVPAKLPHSVSSESPAQPSPTPRKSNTEGGGGGKKAGDRSGDGGVQVSMRPRYKSNPAPDYPAESRKNRQEGLVRIHVWVNAQGNVSSVELRQASGFPRLDEAALQAVRNWKFFPATLGGIGVESFVEIPVRFKLED